MYNAPEIPFETINCTGCRMEGVKFAHCETCKIRVCVNEKGFQTCGDCIDMDTCEIVSFVHKHAPEAIQNLRQVN
jgi:hypothetical protein